MAQVHRLRFFCTPYSTASCFPRMVGIVAWWNRLKPRSVLYSHFFACFLIAVIVEVLHQSLPLPSLCVLSLLQRHRSVESVIVLMEALMSSVLPALIDRLLAHF